jgi:hypothetical protein
MRSLTVPALALAAGVLLALPPPAAAQREAPLARDSRIQPDATAAPLQEPPGNLVSSIYMVPLKDLNMDPLKDLNARKAFSGLTTAQARAERRVHPPGSGG